MLRNVENPTSDCVSFSMSNQRYFNVDPQRETTLIGRLNVGWDVNGAERKTLYQITKTQNKPYS